MRPSFDIWALEMAILVSRRGTCCRRAVGCVLVNERRHILATGYNGVASGMPHCNHLVSGKFPHKCEGSDAPSGQDLDKCQAIHAEQNALLQCKDSYDIHTAYVTTGPCITCTKLLLNTSCERIVFAERYAHDDSKALWESANRLWVPSYTLMGS